VRTFDLRQHDWGYDPNMTTNLTAPIVIATLMNPTGETGVQTHFNVFREYLQSREVQVELLTPFSAQAWLVWPVFAVRRILDRCSGSLSVWWYRYWHMVFLGMALRSRLRRLRRVAVPVVYAQCPLSALAALRARPDADIRVVMVVHFNVSQADEWVGKGKIPASGLMYRHIRRQEAEILPLLDGVVYVSEFMKSTIIGEHPELTKVATTVVPNFCNLPKVSVERSPEYDLINVGSLEPRKNQRYLLSVVAYARQSGLRLKLALVGDGPERQSLTRLAHELEIADDVEFLGYQADAINLMRRAKLYVHSATIENLPLALIESLACGVPVLAPAIGGIPEIFTDGREGYFLTVDDVAQATEKIRSVLEDAVLYRGMAANARQRYLEYFSTEHLASRLYGFLVSFTPHASVIKP
jgi:glycosyltransferase involved in cell wall biosynthesis